MPAKNISENYPLLMSSTVILHLINFNTMKVLYESSTDPDQTAANCLLKKLPKYIKADSFSHDKKECYRDYLFDLFSKSANYIEDLTLSAHVLLNLLNELRKRDKM